MTSPGDVVAVLIYCNIIIYETICPISIDRCPSRDLAVPAQDGLIRFVIVTANCPHSRLTASIPPDGRVTAHLQVRPPHTTSGGRFWADTYKTFTTAS